MPLIPTPATISDGTSNHIYTLQSSKTEGKSMVTTWKELAASAAENSTFKSKYIEGPTVLRNVAQGNKALEITDGSRTLATINISAVYHTQHDIAELELLGKTVINATSQANFWSNFFNQM
jgi:hypothetical protein